MSINKKLTLITKPEQLCINQMYMWLSYNDLKRGFCKKIEENSVTFSFKNNYSDKVYFIETHYPKLKYTYIAEYNARIYYKYQKLLKNQEIERYNLLNEEKTCYYKNNIIKNKFFNFLFK